MQKEDSRIMQQFLDKLCDHLIAQKVKILIDSGFDEWETITFMKGSQLIDLGFDTKECIVIMVTANSTALQNEQTEIFSEERMKQIIQIAQERDKENEEKIEKQEYQLKMKGKDKEKDGISQSKNSPENSMKSIPSSHQIKEYQKKEITQPMLVKGSFIKVKNGQKVIISKATMINLEEKEITIISNLDKCPNLINLHLGYNYIYKIQNLEGLSKLKVLKLENNNIKKIEGLSALVNLEHLYLSSNYINRLENLTENRKLQQIFISKQKIDFSFTFDPLTTSSLSYTLEKLECKNNKVQNIVQLKYLKVVKQVNLEKNQLADISQLSETISGMQSLKILSFKDCPIAKSQKYRDYIVILSKTLQQLDGKKILAKEREYLVKLYALKHAKQSKQDEKPKAQPKSNKIDIHGMKMQQEYSGHVNINRATDLRGNIPYSNTKHISKK